MQEVAVETAEDDVIGKRCVVGVVGILVVHRQPRRVVAKRYKIHGLLQIAFHVDYGELNIARGFDGLVEYRAVGILRPRIVRQQSGDAIERFAERAVATGQEQAVVAEYSILAGATGSPVVAISADDIVIVAVTEHHIAAGHAEHVIVAGLA